MEKESNIIDNIEEIHTTELGIIRIERNLKLKTKDVVKWCKNKILLANKFYRKGKNWYIITENIKFTINAKSKTIITAHIIKNNCLEDK